MTEAVIIDPVEQRVNQDVQKFDLNDQKISELYDKYTVLTIKDHTDKEGYEVLSRARKDVKAIRVAGDKKRKELNEDANRYVKGVNAYWKTLGDKLETLEETLSEKEEWYLAEKARVKAEEDAAKRKIVEERCAKLIELGFAFNGSEYSFDDGVNPVVNINGVQIENAPQERWDSFVAKATDMVTVFRAKEAERLRLEEIEAERVRKEQEEAENQRLAEEEAERKRQAKIAEDNAKESARLEAIRKEQEEKDRLQQQEREQFLAQRFALRLKVFEGMESYGMSSTFNVGFTGFRSDKTEMLDGFHFSNEEIRNCDDAEFDKCVERAKSHEKIFQQRKKEYEAVVAQEQKELLEKQEREKEQSIADEKKRIAEAEQARIMGMSDIEHLEGFKKNIHVDATDILAKIKQVPVQQEVRNACNKLTAEIDSIISKINSTDVNSKNS